jgi:hypothetical protein
MMAGLVPDFGWRPAIFVGICGRIVTKVNIMRLEVNIRSEKVNIMRLEVNICSEKVNKWLGEVNI